MGPKPIQVSVNFPRPDRLSGASVDSTSPDLDRHIPPLLLHGDCHKRRKGSVVCSLVKLPTVRMLSQKRVR